VSSAGVTVDDENVGYIDRGLMVLVGFADGDGEQQMQWMANKICGLRVFEDEEEKMNLSVGDIGGAVLLVPNFTLYADCQRGRRPSFSGAAAPDDATHLFDRFSTIMQDFPVPVEKGQFGAHMVVCLSNDGPVTLIIDSPQPSS
jgi:D-tyrosyl-tRNA(Tyr) deacylase